MNLFVNPTITGFRQEVDGTIKELKIGEAKEDAYANIIGQASADLDNNKTKTIDVSTYTEPVEVLPTSGKDGMKKATITLSNIPSPGGGTLTLKCYRYYDSEEGVNLSVFSVAPDFDSIVMFVPVSNVAYQLNILGFTYDSSTDTYTDGVYIYTRYEDGDLYTV